MKNPKLQILTASLCLLCSCSAPESTAQNPLPDWAFGGFVRPEGVNPLIEPNEETRFDCPMTGTSVTWEFADTFNPAAVVKDGKICILYRAEDNPNAGIGGRTSRIGLAESEDGTSIATRRTEPVMYPNQTEISKTYEWKGGCEDPRVAVTEDGLYVMTYTAWNNSIPRLAIATSRDLLTWEKHGPAFATAHNGRFKNLGCKSGSIVTEVKDGVQVIAKVNGKYLMYWGEEYVAVATSTDLINWEPVLDEQTNDLLKVIRPRKKYFDSNLTECGPPAVITDKGILLLYNGKNRNDEGQDERFAGSTYSAGQVLFDKNDPYKVIGRLDVPFFRPMADFEKSGQYASGTVFIEGLVYFKDKWYLYYGCADSKVGVAVYDPSKKVEGDPIEIVDVEEGIISNSPANGIGKQIVSVHSCSGYTKPEESPFNLFRSYIDAKKKWCDDKNENPWVIFELTDIYSLSRFVFRDVAPYEKGNGNVPEYWIYTSTTGTSDADFGESLIHKTGQGSVDVKGDRLDTPVDARYVKFVASRGTRTDNGNKENAIRIYGFDIYGTFARAIDRGDLISVGKTVLGYYDATKYFERPTNMLDGNLTNADNKWAFLRAAENDSLKYMVIDLEDTYDISKFKIYDTHTLDPNTDKNMDGYQIFVSTEAPDMSLIDPLEDRNTVWTKVVDATGRVNESIKEDAIEPTTGRYVKLVIPRSRVSTTTRLYQFEVYGKKHTSAVDAADKTADLAIYPTVLQSGDKLNISNPNPARLTLYSLQGNVLAKAEISANASYPVEVGAGNYIVQVTMDGVTRSAKLLVK